MDGALPNFFLVGAPKAGTTSLCHYLDQHPQIYMSPVKEPNYFASELRAENFPAEDQPRVLREMNDLRDYLDGSMREKRFGGLISDWNDYLKLYRDVTTEMAVGEASVCYLWSESAAENIASAVPGAKIIAVLRDPVERAFSQYLHGLGVGLVRWSFRQHIQTNLENRSTVFGPAYPFLEMGLYAEPLTRYFRFFPKENIRVYLYDDYRKDASALLADLFEWLGVDASFTPDLSERHLELPVPRFTTTTQLLFKYGLWNGIKAAIPRPLRKRMRSVVFRNRRSLTMDPADRAFLADYYREDILKTAALLNRDLTHWLRLTPEPPGS